LIEVFCKDGSYYKTDSINNGTSNHPFKLELAVINVIPNQKAGSIIFTAGVNSGNWASVNPLSYESTIKIIFILLVIHKEQDNQKLGILEILKQKYVLMQY